MCYHLTACNTSHVYDSSFAVAQFRYLPSYGIRYGRHHDGHRYHAGSSTRSSPRRGYVTHDGVHHCDRRDATWDNGTHDGYRNDEIGHDGDWHVGFRAHGRRNDGYRPWRNHDGDGDSSCFERWRHGYNPPPTLKFPIGHPSRGHGQPLDARRDSPDDQSNDRLASHPDHQATILHEELVQLFRSTWLSNRMLPSEIDLNHIQFVNKEGYRYFYWV